MRISGNALFVQCVILAATAPQSAVTWAGWDSLPSDARSPAWLSFLQVSANPVSHRKKNHPELNVDLEVCPISKIGKQVRMVLCSHTAAWIVGMLMTISLLHHKCAAQIRKHPFAAHVPDRRLNLFAGRYVRALLAPLLLSGFVFQLYSWKSSCNAANLYVFTCGAWMGAFEVWDWVRNWDILLLEPDTVAHHIGAFLLSILIIGGPGKIDGAVESSKLTFFVSCVGFQWLGDFAMNHVYFATSATSIKTAVRLTLCSCIFRAIAVLLLVWMQYLEIVAKNWLCLSLTIPLFFGYMYMHLNVLRYVWYLDVDRFFDTHQKIWLAEQQSKYGKTLRAELAAKTTAMVEGLRAELAAETPRSKIAAETTATSAPALYHIGDEMIDAAVQTDVVEETASDSSTGSGLLEQFGPACCDEDEDVPTLEPEPSVADLHEVDDDILPLEPPEETVRRT